MALFCCKNILRRDHTTRGVICRRWVTPLRVVVLASIAADAAYVISRQGRISVRAVLLVCIHLFISWLVIGECKRSVDYHRQLAREVRRQGR